MEQQYSDNLMITQQSSKSVRNPIPVDLLIDIFSRVPAKSIARFHCVSKLWKSILGLPYFSELFLTKSVARPRLFFTFKVNEELFFFSSPQPQNSDENSSLVATPYKAFPKHFPHEICTSLYGLVFLRDSLSKVIYNPVTGESITLQTTRLGQCHFGFDPINKKFKVLWSSLLYNSQRVLTLDTGKRLWRVIQTPLPPHYSCDSNEICINGVVYYRAYFAPSRKIVCFDFRSERFDLINADKDMIDLQHMTLFNYKGYLGAHQQTILSLCKGEFEFWVLEDAGKHKWSKRVVHFSRDEMVNKGIFLGMTRTGELVFSPGYKFNSFTIFYYNIERNTTSRFYIQGFEEFKHQGIFPHTILDYVENMKFM